MVEQAKANQATAAAEVERLQAVVSELDGKLADRRKRQALTLTQVANSMADFGAVEENGGSSVEPPSA